MVKAVQVEALADHRVRIRFEDGVEGIADLRGFIGRGVFRIWDEEGVFERVRIGSSGEIDKRVKALVEQGLAVYEVAAQRS